MSHSFRRLSLVAAAVVLTQTGCAPQSPTAVARTPTISPEPGEERIAFSSWSAGKAMIYTMSPDGSRRVAVVEGSDPDFSPDGTRIAFWRFGNGRGVIFVANVDGSNAVELTEGEQPTWSPDGRRLAFACGGICLINVDGSGLTRVTPSALTSDDGEACVRDNDPTWSADGSTIAFTRWPDAQIPEAMCLSLYDAMEFPFDFWTEVWLIDADGSNPRPVWKGRDICRLAILVAQRQATGILRHERHGGADRCRERRWLVGLDRGCSADVVEQPARFARLVA